MVDLSGKTDVYKIACVITYLFIMLDVVKSKNQSSNSKDEPLYDKVYAHSFFKQLEKGMHEEMINNIDEEDSSPTPQMRNT